jgi:hypothetical protein
LDRIAEDVAPGDVKFKYRIVPKASYARRKMTRRLSAAQSVQTNRSDPRERDWSRYGARSIGAARERISSVTAQRLDRVLTRIDAQSRTLKYASESDSLPSAAWDKRQLSILKDISFLEYIG